MRFDEIGLAPKLLKSLEKRGYEEMTPIQEKTFPTIVAGKDLRGLAETGSGKTAACIIPLVEKVDVSLKKVQVLVLVPTRELCMQYTDEVTALSASTGIKPFCLYGGFSKTIQVNKLNDCVHILIATPGRLIDHLYDRTIDLSHVKCVILDEADELLNAGFLPDTEFILSCIVHEHQTLLFSATMPEDIKKLSHDYLKEPVHVDLIQKRAAPTSIDHYFSCLPFSRWQEKLVHYIRTEDYKQMLIFCDSRIRVEKVFKALRQDLPDIEYIHAGLSQEKRSSIFNRFKKQKIRCLIATDVAGRGLDFSHVTHVVNWGLPRAKEQYTHRTGRTGRMGRSGKAMTFLGNRDLSGLKGIIHKNKIKPRWIGRAPSIR